MKAREKAMLWLNRSVEFITTERDKILQKMRNSVKSALSESSFSDEDAEELWYETRKYPQLMEKVDRLIKDWQETGDAEEVGYLLKFMEEYEEVAAIRCITGKTSARFEKLFKEVAKRLDIAVAEPPICRHCGKTIEVVGDDYFDYLSWNLCLIDKI